MKDGFRCLFRAHGKQLPSYSPTGSVSSKASNNATEATPATGQAATPTLSVNQLQLLVCLLSDRKVPITLRRTDTVEDLLIAVHEAQRLGGSVHRCRQIEFRGKLLLRGASLTEYLFDQGSMLREMPDTKGGMRKQSSPQCRFEGCCKWVVVGDKYCAQHAGMVDPLSVRKVSLAHISSTVVCMLVLAVVD